MAKNKQRSYEEAVSWLREHGFDISDTPATPGRVSVKKHGCSAAIQRDDKTAGVALFAKPGFLIGGEISRLIDKGYQKFLKTSKLETPATADHLKAVHKFTEELCEGMGATSLYNEALGTVSDRYQYDRIVNRDQPESGRKKRPWEVSGSKAKKGA